jgi:hypothetical protein
MNGVDLDTIVPAIAAVVRDGPHLSADETFRIGLDFLLDGIEARNSS